MNEMIYKRLKMIDDLKDELNGLKATYEEMLADDDKYQEVEEELNKVKDESKQKKAEILSNHAYQTIIEEMKETRKDIKDNKEALSQELVEYYRESGMLRIEDHQGNVKRLKFTVRLVD